MAMRFPAPPTTIAVAQKRVARSDVHGAVSDERQEAADDNAGDENDLLAMIYSRMIYSIDATPESSAVINETEEVTASPVATLGALGAFPGADTSDGRCSYNDGDSEVLLDSPEQQGYTPTPTSIGRHLRRRPAFSKGAHGQSTFDLPAPKGAVKKEQQVNEKTLTRARTAKVPLTMLPPLPPGLLEGVCLRMSK